MNTNKILTLGFSNRVTLWEYKKKHAKYDLIEFQCSGCSFFAPFDADYGLCCYTKSRFLKKLSLNILDAKSTLMKDGANIALVKLRNGNEKQYEFCSYRF